MLAPNSSPLKAKVIPSENRQINNLDWLRDKTIYVEAKIDEALASLKSNNSEDGGDANCPRHYLTD